MLAPLQDESGDDNHQYEAVSSEDDGLSTQVETPITPFSPARPTKFPSELKTIKCTFEGCTKTFNRPARLQAHLRSHTNERPFVCTYEGCDKSYLQEKHLKQHIKGSHTHERSYPCEWEGCDKYFLTATRLRRHQDAHQGNERFRCTAYPPCNQTFRKHQTLQRHIRSDHLDLAPYLCTLTNPLTNEPCLAGFDGATGLRKHQDTAHTPPQFMCNVCIVPGQFTPQGQVIYLGFTTQKQLDIHVRKCHADCLFCERKFASQRELQKHIESQHSGTTLEERKNIRCTFTGCLKTFTKKSNLTAHIRTAHNGERFICGTFNLSATPAFSFWDSNTDGCGKDFVSKASLEDHVRTAHLGLPSQTNGNRKKAVKTNLGDDGKGIGGAKKKRSKKQKPNFIENFVGLDERRDIPCPVEGCENMFMRLYDVEVHLRARHQHPAVNTQGASGHSSFAKHLSLMTPTTEQHVAIQDDQLVLDPQLAQMGYTQVGGMVLDGQGESHGASEIEDDFGLYDQIPMSRPVQEWFE